jgi:hypothetical protein
MLYACAFDQQAALDRERQATAWLGDKLRGERQAHAEILRANAARDATALAAAPVLAAAPALAAAPSATREGATHRLLHQRLAPGFRSRALGLHVHDMAERAPSADVDAELARGRWRAVVTRVVRPPSPSGDFSLD